MDTKIACGSCKDEIIDEIEDSVLCDICSEWFHADKKCSSLKKSHFKILTKNDTWVCNACIVLGKSYKNELPLAVLKQTIQELTSTCETLKLEKQNLCDELSIKEIEVQVLRDKLSSKRSSISFENVSNNVSVSNLTSPIVSVHSTPRPRSIVGPERSILRPGPNAWNKVVARGRGGARCTQPAGVSQQRDRGRLSMELNANRFSVLSVDEEQTPRCMSESECRPKPKFSKRKKKKRVRIMADSHGWECSERVQRGIGEKWDVSGNVVGGAPMTYILDGVLEVMEEGKSVGGVVGWSNEDWVVTVGGTNNISEGSLREVEERLVRLREEWEENIRPNMLFVETTLHCGEQQEKLNNMIIRQNKIIENHCLQNKWHFLKVNSKLSREDFGASGLHLSKKGKRKLCHLLTEKIQQKLGPEYQLERVEEEEINGSFLQTSRPGTEKG